MLLFVSCYRNWDKLQPDGLHGSFADFLSINVDCILCNREAMTIDAHDNFTFLCDLNLPIARSISRILLK